MLGHLEGRLDKVIAVIRQVAVQGKALELDVPEGDEDGAGSGESSGELEIPALQSNMGEHRIVDIQEPAPGPSKPWDSQEEPSPSPSIVKKDDRRDDGEVWPSPKSREQKEVRSLEVKAQGDGQQEASEGQSHPGGGNRHADCLAGRLNRSGRLSGIRLQQF